MHRVGARELLVQPAGGRQRLLPIRHLIREPIARLELGMREREQGEECKADEGVEARMAHHPIDNPADEFAQPIHQGIRGRVILGESPLIADEEDGEQGQDDDDRDEGDHCR